MQPVFKVASLRLENLFCQEAIVETFEKLLHRGSKSLSRKNMRMLIYA
jgi:hypothetical protein